MFFADSSTDELLKYDGSNLRTPRDESFRILPLVMPKDPDFPSASRSITASRYWERHVGPASLSLLVISTRSESEARRLIVSPFGEILHTQQKLLQFLFFNPEKPGDPKALIESLKNRPPMAIIFSGTDRPLEAYQDKEREQVHKEIKRLMGTKKWKDCPPEFVVVGDWMDCDS